jgi:hypothetical protein
MFEMLGLKKKKKTEQLEQGLSPHKYRIYNLQEAQIYVQSEWMTTHISKHWAHRPQPVLVVGVYSNMPTTTVYYWNPLAL